MASALYTTNTHLVPRRKGYGRASASVNFASQGRAPLPSVQSVAAASAPLSRRLRSSRQQECPMNAWNSWASSALHLLRHSRARASVGAKRASSMMTYIYDPVYTAVDHGRILFNNGEIPGAVAGLAFGFVLGYLIRSRSPVNDPWVVPEGWERVRLAGVLRYRDLFSEKQVWTIDEIVEFKIQVRMEEEGVKTGIRKDIYKKFKVWRSDKILKHMPHKQEDK